MSGIMTDAAKEANKLTLEIVDTIYDGKYDYNAIFSALASASSSFLLANLMAERGEVSEASSTESLDRFKAYLTAVHAHALKALVKFSEESKD